jgi:uncharacterized protein (TIGR02246 family)
MSARAPEDLDALVQRAFNQGDLEAVMGLYEPDAVFSNQQGELRSGSDAIRQEMAPFTAMKPDIKIEVTKVITAGEIAVMYSRWSMTTPSQMSGQSVEVARRQQDGNWLFVIDDPGA